MQRVCPCGFRAVGEGWHDALHSQRERLISRDGCLGGRRLVRRIRLPAAFVAAGVVVDEPCILLPPYGQSSSKNDTGVILDCDASVGGVRPLLRRSKESTNELMQ